MTAAPHGHGCTCPDCAAKQVAVERRVLGPKACAPTSGRRPAGGPVAAAPVPAVPEPPEAARPTFPELASYVPAPRWVAVYPETLAYFLDLPPRSPE